MSKHRGPLLAVVLLLALSVAGCAVPEEPDGGTGDARPPVADGPCKRDDHVQWGGAFSEPMTGNETFCWRNANHTADDLFYFVLLRDRGTGEWGVTVLDATNTTFVEATFGPGRNYRCNDRGEPGVPGNWTIHVWYRQATGNPTVRLDSQEPDDWQCIDA